MSASIFFVNLISECEHYKKILLKCFFVLGQLPKKPNSNFKTYNILACFSIHFRFQACMFFATIHDKYTATQNLTSTYKMLIRDTLAYQNLNFFKFEYYVVVEIFIRYSIIDTTLFKMQKSGYKFLVIFLYFDLNLCFRLLLVLLCKCLYYPKCYKKIYTLTNNVIIISPNKNKK